MIELFAVGTAWFWTLLSILAVVFIAVQENSEYPGGWTTFGVVITFVLLYYCGAGVSLKQLGLHIYHNPGETVVYFSVYVVAGILWSFFKWGLYVNLQSQEYEKRLKKDPNSSDPFRALDLRNTYQPDLSDNKHKIFNWIFYWPFSFVWFCIHEPVQRVFEVIMKNCTKVYEGITQRAFNRVKVPGDAGKSKDLVQ